LMISFVAIGAIMKRRVICEGYKIGGVKQVRINPILYDNREGNSCM